MDISGDNLQRISDAPGDPFGDFVPRWSPNGKQIAFLRDVTNLDNDVYVVDANGRNERRLTNTPDFVEDS